MAVVERERTTRAPWTTPVASRVLVQKARLGLGRAHVIPAYIQHLALRPASVPHSQLVFLAFIPHHSTHVCRYHSSVGRHSNGQTRDRSSSDHSEGSLCAFFAPFHTSTEYYLPSLLFPSSDQDKMMKI